MLHQFIKKLTCRLTGKDFKCLDSRVESERPELRELREIVAKKRQELNYLASYRLNLQPYGNIPQPPPTYSN